MPELVPLLGQLPWLDQAVRLLDFDPDLAPGLAGQALAAAASQCVARARLLPRATWLDPAELASGGIGLFMLRGLILRWTRVGSGASAELGTAGGCVVGGVAGYNGFPPEEALRGSG